MQALKELIITTAFADSLLKTKVKNRVYPTELALVEKPIYPCVNFKIDGGQDYEYSMKLRDVNFYFHVFSTASFDAAYAIYADIKRLFAFQSFTDANLSAVFREFQPPLENGFVSDGIAVYSIVTRWLAKTIIA